MAVAVPVLVLAPAFPVFVAGMAAYGVALGVVDASTNMQAVAIEHGYGRPILPSFHGMWTLGGIVGSIITLATSSVSFDVGRASSRWCRWWSRLRRTSVATSAPAVARPPPRPSRGARCC